MAANEDYVQKEMSAETMEGTATYAGIQASRRVGYDFGVMYFSNRKDVPFSEIITQYLSLIHIFWMRIPAFCAFPPKATPTGKITAASSGTVCSQAFEKGV